MRNVLSVITDVLQLLYKALATPEGEALLSELLAILDGQAFQEQPPAQNPPASGQAVKPDVQHFYNPR